MRGLGGEGLLCQGGPDDPAHGADVTERWAGSSHVMKIEAKTYLKTVLLITCFPLTKSDLCPQRDSSNRQGKQKAGRSTGHGSSRSCRGGLCSRSRARLPPQAPSWAPPLPPTTTFPHHHDAQLGWGVRGRRATAPLCQRRNCAGEHTAAIGRACPEDSQAH